jgi:3-deoxy-D-manno-octulosonic acid kinase
MTMKYWQTNKQHILYQDGLQPKAAHIPFDIDLFEPEKLLAAKKVYATANGRGTSYFFKNNDQDWILKHYWRGGLMGKICKDCYFSLPAAVAGIKQTRPFLELNLLHNLEQLGLPAPKPIAGRICYRGLCYRADLITGTIPNSQSLVQALQASIDSELWKKIGRTIALFHRHNIYHDDLNAHNILIDSQQEVFLIDFDKGKQVSSTAKGHWKQENLGRLLRSLNKEKSKGSITCFTEDEWKQLLTGYRQP